MNQTLPEKNMVLLANTIELVHSTLGALLGEEKVRDYFGNNLGRNNVANIVLNSIRSKLQYDRWLEHLI